MMPFLNDRAVTAGAAKSMVPPLRFKPLVYPSHVRLVHAPYIKANGSTAAQKNGLRYEDVVQRRLLATFADYKAGSHIHFLDDSIARSAQPDGLLIYNDYVFIFEIKYQHCPEAWWQLERLYSPLIKKIYPSRQVSVVEICRSYDPSTPFPCEVERFEDIVEWISEPQLKFGVWECRRP